MLKNKCREHYAEERRLLRKAMLDKKLVVFVGSGTSLESGMPSWGKAVEIIADKLNILGENLDYMKIPQFYYNSRGKKEYVELMREIFRYHDDLEICDVHRNIIKLDTHTIITTNYDCLLEKAATENAEFIQVISQDKDLPYRTVEKELIKMHGDFLHGNFVLREDDYLYYSKNFKLIEAYIKSLIATNVVLFVGYSFSDPDVKQIFSWVKDILEDDFQRAYMLEVCKEFDFHEHDYYKNLGVNVIYASEMYDEFDKNKASIYTNDFLEYILEEDSSENQIDELYKKCQSYSYLNYICTKYINAIFRSCGIIMDCTNLMAIDVDSEEANKLLSALFCEEDDAGDGKRDLIREVILKSAVEQVTIYNGKTNKSINIEQIEIDTNPATKFSVEVENFDFAELRKLREENEVNLSDITPELYLEQAYISYILFDYAKAYRYLRICSKLFYAKKQYVWYFISEVNRKNVGKIIEQDFFSGYNDSEKEKIKAEVDVLDIETIYRKIPVEELGSKEFLQDLYTFRTYYTLFQSTYLKSKKTEKEAKTNYSLYSGIPGYVKLRAEIQDCYYYDLNNYIMIDRYQEDIETYRLFARTIINSACSTQLSSPYSDGNDVFNVGNIHVEALEKFDVYIILRYMDQDELKSLLRDSGKEFVNINEEARSYLQSIVKNLFQIEIENTRCQYCWIYLTLIGYIKLDYELVDQTIQALIDVIGDYNVRVHYNEMMRFIYWADKQNMFENEICRNALKLLIDKLAQVINNIGMSLEKNRYYGLLRQCLTISKKVEEEYISKDLLLLANSKDYDFLAGIYPFCAEAVQSKIQNSVSGWEWKNDYKQVEVYEKLVLNGNLEADESIEEYILTNLEQLKESSKGSSPNLYEQVISSITNLYLSDKICKKEEIKEAIKNSGIDVYKWIVEAENFDYEHFNIFWLNYCSSALLETITSFPIAKKRITSKIKEAYLSGGADKEILKKYFEFFVDK